ncbi:hypothetical protein GLX27_001895 [Malassezia furfur]|uniref:Dolichyl-diphosphooligosaccharide-protein glycosyltransferase subunit OST5 n=1 Tax=Malassezia furfur TaxID=55194 RepID=A0ABY8EQK5_MALFU|nr:hypothetical protein GLX27_001895 [Malassezia furfur]
MTVDYAAYKAVQDEFRTLPDARPMIPVHAMRAIALVSLVLSFALAFFFSTFPRGKRSLPKVLLAIGASLFAGTGVVALFNAVGVHL